MRFILALAVLALVSTAASSQTTMSFGTTRPSDCRQFTQVDCLRFDVPSARAGGNIPPGANGQPGGPQTMAALRDGTVQAAGRRSVVFLVWGLGNVPASALGAYQHRLPHTDVQNVRVEEIAASMAPAFDPASAPPGPARAFRVTFSGGMVSFQLPRSAVGEGAVMILCPDGPSVYPDRVTVREGVRSQNAIRFAAADMRRWAHELNGGQPRFDRVTTRPVVWNP
jgi:hypothetical protein